MGRCRVKADMGMRPKPMSSLMVSSSTYSPRGAMRIRLSVRVCMRHFCSLYTSKSSEKEGYYSRYLNYKEAAFLLDQHFIPTIISNNLLFPIFYYQIIQPQSWRFLVSCSLLPPRYLRSWLLPLLTRTASLVLKVVQLATTSVVLVDKSQTLEWQSFRSDNMI